MIRLIFILLNHLFLFLINLQHYLFVIIFFKIFFVNYCILLTQIEIYLSFFILFKIQKVRFLTILLLILIFLIDFKYSLINSHIPYHITF